MRARISADLFSNFEQINLLAGVQAMADQEMSWSLNPLPYHLVLVDVGLSARRNLNLVYARVSASELPGAPNYAPGYAHSTSSQRAYETAFARDSGSRALSGIAHEPHA